MYRMDNVDNPPNIDDASYSEHITGAEDHEEEPYHNYNTDGNHKGHLTETQDAPTAEQTMPIYTQTTKDQ